MKRIESILTRHPCYAAGRTIAIKGLMLHSVGCSQPSASVFVREWNNPGYERACVHAFIDGSTGDVYQTLPWDYRGWHCGTGTSGQSANNTHIGIEMCEPACIAYTGGTSFTFVCTDLPAAKAVAKRTYETAVELFAVLCRRYVVTGVLTCALPISMDGFRMAVQAAAERENAAAVSPPESSPHRN